MESEPRVARAPIIRRRRRWILSAAIAVLALSSCGESAPSISSTGDDVRIHGIVTNLTLASCDDVGTSDSSNIQITFEDGLGNVVGTATTGKTTLTPSSGYCAASAPYSVTVARKELYEANVPGLRNPERMAYDELERASFRWDLGAEIQVDEGS